MIKFFDEIFGRRIRQLQSEAQIDTTLKCLPCDKVVADFLLLQRQLNREQMQSMNDISIWNYYRKTMDHMTDIDRDHRVFTDFVVRYDFDQGRLDPLLTCQNLKKYVNICNEGNDQK